MIIPYSILVGTEHQDRQIIGTVVQIMEFEYLLDILKIHELIYLPIRIACDIHDRSVFGGLLVGPVNRNDREELLNSPEIRNGLEDREIAYIFFRKKFIQVIKIIGFVLGFPRECRGLLAYLQEKLLAFGLILKFKFTQIEQGKKFLTVLQGVVIILDIVLDVYFLQCVVQVPYYMRLVPKYLDLILMVAVLIPFDVYNKNRMIRSDRTPAF